VARRLLHHAQDQIIIAIYGYHIAQGSQLGEAHRAAARLHGARGGKSVGPYAGLNVSYRVGDDAKVVSQNVCDMKLAIGIHDGGSLR
jgi:hypothetical protein